VARLGVIIMLVITTAVAVTSCGQGDRSLFSDTTAAPAPAADDPPTSSEDNPETRPAAGR
jgi:hypothetical protein